MSATCVEVSQITVNEAYKTNPTIAQPALDILSEVKGLVTAFQGLDLENLGNLYFFQEWETLQHHVDFQADQVAYDKLLEVVARFTSGYKLFHVYLDDSPLKAFSSPVSEVTTWSLKEGTEAETFTSRLHGFIRAQHEQGALGGKYGTIVEDNRAFAVVIGWESREARRDVLEGPGEFRRLVTELQTIAVPVTRLFRLTPFKA